MPFRYYFLLNVIEEFLVHVEVEFFHISRSTDEMADLVAKQRIHSDTMYTGPIL